MTRLDIRDINKRCISDPIDFIGQCEQDYTEKIRKTAEDICKNRRKCPIVLLNGPSSSGKTTTAGRLRDELEKMGVCSHAISMDDYYLTRGTYPIPRDEEGEMDLESPECMDLPLLSEHLAALARSETIAVPQYNFEKRSRTDYTQEIQLKKDEVAVIEGIHSLNEIITGRLNDRAVGVYMSIGTEIVINNDYRLAPHKLRFVRRAIRDKNFRSEPISGTINMWRSVRRGEKLYIHPYASHAAHIIDTYLPYEDCVLMNILKKQAMPYLGQMHTAGLDDIINALGLFENITDVTEIPDGSIMHEFIG